MVDTTMIGGSAFESQSLPDTDQQAIHQTNRDFWNATKAELLNEIALPQYGAFVSEEKVQLLGSLADKKVLEIGCGRGLSLKYMAAQDAGELWGLDLSESQLAKAKQQVPSAHLFCAPMEADCGLPTAYFDMVYSIYALGWTTDLDATLARIASYLKVGGHFIFSWSHPIHKCVALENDQLIFKKSYFDEDWYKLTTDEGSLSLSDRKLSTYLNALTKAGFLIEQVVEESDVPDDDTSDFAAKARMFPVTFVVKARKL